MRAFEVVELVDELFLRYPHDKPERLFSLAIEFLHYRQAWLRENQDRVIEPGFDRQKGFAVDVPEDNPDHRQEPSYVVGEVE